MKHWILNNTNTDRQQCVAYMQILPHFLNYSYLPKYFKVSQQWYKLCKNSFIIFTYLSDIFSFGVSTVDSSIMAALNYLMAVTVRQL